MRILIINPQALFLDLDGTLADSLWVMRFAYGEFLQSFEVVPCDAEFAALNGPPLSEIIRRLKVAHQLKEEERTLFIRYNKVIDQIYGQVKPSTGAQVLLQKAKDHQCIVGVVTSNAAERTKRWLENVDLLHFIDFIVSGDDVRYGKPHPEPYLLATKLAEKSPIKKIVRTTHSIIAVEDSVQGATSSIEAGLPTFLLKKNAGAPHLSVEALPQGAQLICSLHELATRLWSSPLSPDKF